MNKSKDGWKQLIELCLTSKNPKTLDTIFDLFLTPEEKADISTRYLIIKELLQKNKTQRQIAKDLNVSIAKITRGSNELKRLDPKFLTFLKEILLK